MHASHSEACLKARHRQKQYPRHLRHQHLRSSMAPKVLKHAHLPQHFCHCNIFDNLAARHRMFICQKIMLSQALEMCTQFTPFKDDIYSRCTIKKKCSQNVQNLNRKIAICTNAQLHSAILIKTCQPPLKGRKHKIHVMHKA